MFWIGNFIELNKMLTKKRDKNDRGEYFLGLEGPDQHPSFEAEECNIVALNEKT